MNLVKKRKAGARKCETGQKVSAVRRSNPFHSSACTSSSLASWCFLSFAPLFLHLPLCLRLNAGVMEREQRSLLWGGGKAMKPLSKPRSSYCVHIQPFAPETGPLSFFPKPVLLVESARPVVSWRYGSCLWLDCAPGVSLELSLVEEAASRRETGWFMSGALHFIHIQYCLISSAHSLFLMLQGFNAVFRHTKYFCLFSVHQCLVFCILLFTGCIWVFGCWCICM